MKVGVIGAGWVAQNRYLPALSKYGAEVVLCDRNANALNACNVLDKVSSVPALLNYDLDAVIICTDPASHIPVLLRVKSQRPEMKVLVEKPLADSIPAVLEARPILRQIKVAHSFIFASAVEHIYYKYIYSRDKWGHLLFVHGVQYSSMKRRLPTWYDSLPGGLYWDEAPHMLYLAGHFAGSLEVLESVTLKGEDFGSTPKQVSASLLGAGDIPVTFVMNFQSPVSEWHMQLGFEGGLVDLDLFRNIAVEIPSDGDHSAWPVARSTLKGTFDHLKGVAKEGVKYAVGNELFGHDKLVATFLEEPAEIEKLTRSPKRGDDPFLKLPDGYSGWGLLSLMRSIL